jgi:hypothetical protein
LQFVAIEKDAAFTACNRAAQFPGPGISLQLPLNEAINRACTIRIPAYYFSDFIGAKRFCMSEQINRFDNAGLSLTVFAKQEADTGWKEDLLMTGKITKSE